MITHERLKELVSYDPIRGIFIWLKRTGSRAHVGAMLGCRTGNGYIECELDGDGYSIHRLAWFYMKGEWPKAEIDHIDGVRDNNSWDNLRAATRSENRCNVGKYSSNTSGYKGVSWSNAARKWVAQIQHQGKPQHLGCFHTPEEAHSVYIAAAAAQHGEFARSG